MRLLSHWREGGGRGCEGEGYCDWNSMCVLKRAVWLHLFPPPPLLTGVRSGGGNVCGGVCTAGIEHLVGRVTIGTAHTRLT
jgi:hypothetical protein